MVLIVVNVADVVIVLIAINVVIVVDNQLQQARSAIKQLYQTQ